MSDISDGNLAVQGSLGSLSLSDLTPHGDLYRERFTTRGGEALIFNIYKYILRIYISFNRPLHYPVLKNLEELVFFHFCVLVHSGMASLIPSWSGNVISRCLCRWPQCSMSTLSASRPRWWLSSSTSPSYRMSWAGRGLQWKARL